ncbi:hypothetical protein HYQ46_006367 [Verticillium longisporum]|nr:hypothetical protein HYQ46_006367 [Verticillium longisporum]
MPAGSQVQRGGAVDMTEHHQLAQASGVGRKVPVDTNESPGEDSNVSDRTHKLVQRRTADGLDSVVVKRRLL